MSAVLDLLRESVLDTERERDDRVIGVLWDERARQTTRTHAQLYLSRMAKKGWLLLILILILLLWLGFCMSY